MDYWGRGEGMLPPSKIIKGGGGAPTLPTPMSYCAPPTLPTPMSHCVTRSNVSNEHKELNDDDSVLWFTT